MGGKTVFTWSPSPTTTQVARCLQQWSERHHPLKKVKGFVLKPKSQASLCPSLGVGARGDR